MNDVGTDTFLDTEGDVFGAIEPRVGSSVFEGGPHVCDVRKIDGFSIAHGQQEMVHLFSRDKLRGDPHIELCALGLETTGRDVHVF